jgi:hypothetical protein
VAFEDDFETGSFGVDWNIIQGGTNEWHVGTDTQKTGTYGAYVSDDGGTTNNYSSPGGGDHACFAYLDIDIPGAASQRIVLEFDWRAQGSAGLTDQMRVYNAPTSFTPTADVIPATTYQLNENQYRDRIGYSHEEIDLDLGGAGTTRRIIFAWTNNSFSDTQPPAAIDNVKIAYL